MTESLTINFRYLVPEQIYDELTEIAKFDHQNKDKISNGWIFANRYEDIAIISKYQVNLEDAGCHNRPKSWIRLKKRKLYTMRKLKKDTKSDIAWQFHTHPTGNQELHDIDLQILKYLTVGVMIIITTNSIIGWYFKKTYVRKPFIDKMVFEVISDEI
jgi:hypothetical protein